MLCVNTSRNVTMMAHTHPSRDRSIFKYPRYSVRKTLPFTVEKQTIPVSLLGTKPHPTIIGLADIFPKSLLRRFCSVLHRAAVTTELSASAFHFIRRSVKRNTAIVTGSVRIVFSHLVSFQGHLVRAGESIRVLFRLTSKVYYICTL